MNGFLEGVLTKLEHIFSPAALGARFAEIFSNLIVALVVLAAFYIAWKILLLFVRQVLARTRLDETAKAFIETILKFALFLVAVVNALNAAGINTSAVLASLGIAGLTIGFAAKDGLSNLISGLLIYIDRPFVIKDLVDIEGNYGQVDRITLRSTRVITSDGKMLAIPNTEIINKTVTSYTNFPHLRLDVPVTVSVREDLNRARSVLLSLVENDPDFMKEPRPRVVVSQLNDYNVELIFQVWLDDERRHVEKRFELRENVFNAFNREGVEMPFETIQVEPVKIYLDKSPE